ncbi:MAG: Maf family protein [Fimbriimonadaceae bacterium]
MPVTHYLAYPVVLASTSPRRQELLRRLVPEFQVFESDVDEDAMIAPWPWETAANCAKAKAEKAFERHPGSIVIAGDTLVVVSGTQKLEQLFKPKDAADARRMLGLLSGNDHRVITGVHILWPRGKKAFQVETTITFRELTSTEIASYVASGEPMDKAGAYAAQGRGAGFIEHVVGSLTNVIGLPLDEVQNALAEIAEYSLAD